MLNEFYRVAFRKKVYRSIDELQADAGSPSHHVPRFQMIAAINIAKTMANPASEPQGNNAKGDRAGRKQYAEVIEGTRPDYGNRRRRPAPHHEVSGEET